MKHFKYIGIWVFVLVLNIPVQLDAQEKQGPINILFVGNSFTYFWNMPQLVEAMAETQGVDIAARQSTVGGSNLEQHWKSEKETITRQLLEEKNGIMWFLATIV